LIKNKQVLDDVWVFAKKSQTTEGKWKLSDGLSAKCDKVFIRYEYVMDINEIQKKYNPEEVVLNDDEISKAPSIIHLDDCEKFKDVDGNPLDIETRGERKSDGIFFKVSDVSLLFDIERLQDMLTQNTSYEHLKDYKYFMCKNLITNEKKTSKINFTKKLFLTYNGILRVLFTSRNNKTTSFVSWATKTLFIAQMGTKEQKQLLSSDLLGIPVNTLKEVFNKDTNTVPCVYLFTFGLVKDLRKSMNIDKSYTDDSIVCKYGFTHNLSKRANEHVKTYGKIINVDVKLKYYTYIDPQYISNGETDIKDFVNGFDWNFKYENYTELLILPNKNMKQIKVQYELIGKKYAGHCEELNKKILELESKIEILKHVNDNEILKYQLNTEKQNVKMMEIEKNNEILELKLQMAKSKN
jgi:hypothetical protein